MDHKKIVFVFDGKRTEVASSEWKNAKKKSFSFRLVCFKAIKVYA